VTTLDTVQTTTDRMRFVKTTTASKSRTAALIRPTDLGIKVQAGLRHGWRDAGYRNEEALDFAVVASAKRRGYSLTEVVNSYLLWGSIRTPAVVRQRVKGGDRAAVRYLTKRWDNVDAATDRHAAAALMSTVRERAYTIALPGRGGPAERAVLSVVADAGVIQGTTTPHVGRLDFIILSGLDEHSYNDALHRLARTGVVTQRERGDDTRRSTWLIRLPANEPIPGRSTKDAIPQRTALLGLVPPPWSDLFRVLGLPSWEIYAFIMVHGEATAGEAARLLGRHVGTVRDHLKGLAELSLVERLSDGSWTLGPATLAAATTAAGADGASDIHEMRALSRAVERRAWLDARDEAVASVHRAAARRAHQRDSVLAPEPVDAMPLIRPTRSSAFPEPMVMAPVGPAAPIAEPCWLDDAWATALEADYAMRCEMDTWV